MTGHATPDDPTRTGEDVLDSGGLRAVITEPDSATLVIEVAGEIDLATAPQLDALLSGALVLDRHTLVVADLTRVGFLGVAGITVLLNHRARAHGHYVTFRIVAQARSVLRPLLLLGLDTAFDIHATLAEALR